MISGVSGLNSNAIFDFNGSHEENLKARKEREIANSTVAQPNSTRTERVDYYASDPDELNEDELAA